MKNKKVFKIFKIFFLLFLIFGIIFLIIENIELLQQNKNTSPLLKNIENIKNIKDIKDIKDIKLARIREEIDLYSNNSLQKYVSESTKIPKDYQPAGLKNLDTEYSIVDKTFWNTIPQLVFQAKNSFSELSKAFYENFWKKLRINSAYRPRQEQYYLIQEGCNTMRCASIGASEHQLGLAIDLAVGITDTRKAPLQLEYLERMNNEAYKYWFINTYQKGFQIDGKMKETWHRRYVGFKLAKFLHDKQLSFAEFYQAVENQK